MVKVKFGEKLLPKEFVSVRSANMALNKLVREYIKQNVPGGMNKVSKQYFNGLRNKFSVVEEPTRLRKGGAQSF